MGPRAFNRVCASIRINSDNDVVSVRINAHGVTKRAWAFNCETRYVRMVRIHLKWPFGDKMNKFLGHKNSHL